MDTNTLIRLAGPAGILAACVGIPSDLYHFTIDSRASAADTFLFKAHGIGLVTAMILLVIVLAGIALRLGDRLGKPGRVAVAMAYVGTLLVLSNIATEAFMMPMAPEALSDPTGYALVTIIVSFALFAAGWFGVALSAGRSGSASPPAVLALCLGSLYGFTPFPGSYTLMLVGIAATAWSTTRVQERELQPLTT